MALMDDIRDKVLRSEYEFTKHAVDRTILRHISVAEIGQAVENGEIIENYPNDKYGPSCLILGFTHTGRPLHLQITHPGQNILKLITVYVPDPAGWVDFRKRR